MVVVYSGFIDVMAEPGEVFHVVGDLMSRGHYLPDTVMAIRETAPRPPSPTEKFLPGQRISFLLDGKQMENEISGAEEWDQAEARVIERPVRPSKGEVLEWRMSELTPGTIRITLTFSAEFGTIEKLKRAVEAKKFWGVALERLKSYIEEKESFAGPRTFAPKPPPLDPLAG